MRTKYFIAAALMVGVFLFSLSPAHAQADSPVFRAVLFYSPTCPHCEYVIKEVLPPLTEQYGTRLQIAYIDVSQPGGNQLFLTALQHFGLQSSGVPFLVAGERYLLGSQDIPEKLPGMIEASLDSRGTDWPAIPAIRQAIAAAAPQNTPDTQTSSITKAPGEPGWQEIFARDPVANSIASVVLVGMLAAVGWAVAFFRQQGKPKPTSLPAWLIPMLCALGLVVAGYLAYVEATDTAAVCGPVGDCNAVQRSPYARLFGIFPVGQLGLLGYAAILTAWWLSRSASERKAGLGWMALFLMAYFGTWFSIYLTFLEPFVIGATCAWCVTSALLMTVLMIISAAPAKSALARLAPPPRR